MGTAVSVAILVGPDNVGDGLTALLTAGRGPLDVAVYEVGPYYARTLRDAAASGRRVRLLTAAGIGDGANTGTAALLRGTPVTMRELGHAGAAAHWKVVVAGAIRDPLATLAVGSGNLLKLDAPRHAATATNAPLAGTREWWVTVTGAPDLVRVARRAVDEAWSRAGNPLREKDRPPTSAPEPVRPAPAAVGTPVPQHPPLRLAVDAGAVSLATGAAAVAAMLAERVEAARSRLLVAVPYVHAGAAEVRPLLAALGAARDRGVEVRRLLGEPPLDGAAAAGLAALDALRINVRVMNPLRSTRGHVKGLIADDTVVCGSANWSRAGLGHNLEAALAVRSSPAAAHLAAVFDQDWTVSTR